MLHCLAMFSSPNIHLPADFNTNFLMITRWIHFLAGITWIGLLYFFNLVNVPFQKELDAATKGKVVPALMPRALWWFRMAAVLTVFAGLAYWGNVVGADAHNGGGPGRHGHAYLLRNLDRGVGNSLRRPDPWKRRLGQRPGDRSDLRDRGNCGSLAIPVPERSWLGKQSAALNRHRRRHGLGDDAERVGSNLAHPKAPDRLDERQRANGTPIPEQSKRMARMAFLASRANAVLSIPMLFFMGAASHYPMFGK